MMLVFVSVSFVACTEDQAVDIDGNVRELGSINMDYPTDVDLDAEEGDFVLAPSLSMFDEFLLDPNEETLNFYHKKLVDLNDKESVIVDVLDGEYSIPNAMIIPIASEQVVEKGDVVLTWWQSGSGMSLAKVIEGGKEPVVSYLDEYMAYDNVVLPADSFVKMTGDLSPGVPVVVNDDGSFIYETLISVAGDKVLTQGFASAIYVRDKINVKPINVYESYAVGDDVYVPVVSSFNAGVVVDYDAEYGMVDVEYTWVSDPEVETFPVSEVVKVLE